MLTNQLNARFVMKLGGVYLLRIGTIGAAIAALVLAIDGRFLPDFRLIKIDNTPLVSGFKSYCVT